jgi:hypothetical protein
MSTMLERLHRTRRRLARATLAGFALFWALTALTPCVMAAQCMGMDMSAHCAHSGYHNNAQKPPCHPAAKADCRNIDQGRLDNSAPADSFSLHTPVLLQTLAPTTHVPNLQCALQHQRNAAAVPRPPLNLLHARLLI